MQRFSGTNVVVTGAASGLGRAVVVRLVSEGAAVHALDHDEVGLVETMACAIGSGRASATAVPSRDRPAAADAVSTALGALGSIDLLVTVTDPRRAGLPVETWCREVVLHLPDDLGVVVNVVQVDDRRLRVACDTSSRVLEQVHTLSLALGSQLVERGIRVAQVRARAGAGPVRLAARAAAIADLAAPGASHLTDVDLDGVVVHPT